MIVVGLFLLCLSSSETLQFTPMSQNIHVMKNIDLGFTGDLVLSPMKSHTRRVLCVVDSWAIHRKGHGKFQMEDVNATLCTHLIIRSVQILKDRQGKRGFVLLNRDLSEEESDYLYRKAADLTTQHNPELKLILSVGGWKQAVKKFQQISSDTNTRSKFAKYIAEFLKEKVFHGVILEWIWPGDASKGGKHTDKNAVTYLIASLSKVLKAQNLELGLTLPADTDTIEASYDIPALEGSVDYFIILGQDLAGNWGQNAGHHSPLLPLTEKTVGKTVEFILDKNISAHKVILGIPFAGRTFRLRDAQADGSGLGAPILNREEIQGAFIKYGKFFHYNEICYELRYSGNNWTVYKDENAKVPFMKDGEGNWVSFDDTKSVQAKVEFGEERGLGGYAAWSITSDDFKGKFCSRKIKYPLLRTINHILTLKQLGKENGTVGGTQMNGSDDGSSVVTFVVVSLLGISFLFVAVFFLVWRKRGGDEEKEGKKRGLSNSEIRRFKLGYNYGAVEDKRNTQTLMMEQLQGQFNFNRNPYDNSLEVPHTEYEIYADEILESGANGVLLKGKVRNELVAVKTVKPLASKDNVLSLLEEVNLLTQMGRHENVLSLIGANTALLRRGIVYVFMELCPLGTLENYLKAKRSNFVDLMKNDEFTCEKSKPEEDSEAISSGTLLIWAHQISNAMQFLTSKKVIHGDLGARNVHLRSKHSVKISDFGSSRKICAYCNYINENQDLLPWRHMSLETLTNLEFSTQSDVWAFGVTLWEIFSLGSLPYPGMSFTFGFTDNLMGGLRMSKPKYATTELYEKTMLQTWNENPKDRPSFDSLCTFLYESVERVAFQQNYIKLDALK